MLDERFSFKNFAQGDPDRRDQNCRDLADELSKIVLAGPTFNDAVLRSIEELRLLGHDLWSYDEDFDRQVWGADYRKRRPGAGLLVEFRGDGRVEVEWAPPKKAK